MQGPEGRDGESILFRGDCFFCVTELLCDELRPTSLIGDAIGHLALMDRPQWSLSREAAGAVGTRDPRAIWPSNKRLGFLPRPCPQPATLLKSSDAGTVEG